MKAYLEPSEVEQLEKAATCRSARQAFLYPKLFQPYLPRSPGNPFLPGQLFRQNVGNTALAERQNPS